MADKTTYELISLTRSDIRGIDPEIENFLVSVGYETDTSIDLGAWSPETAQLVYSIAPMVVVARKNKFDVIGSGRAWCLAQELFASGQKFPALCLTAKRIDTRTKLQFVAAEMFGLAAEYRTRRHIPKRLMALWEQLNAQKIPTILGVGSQAFSQGTGYSLESLKE